MSLRATPPVWTGRGAQLSSVPPRAEVAAIYSAGHRVYQSPYPALKPFFGMV